MRFHVGCQRRRIEKHGKVPSLCPSPSSRADRCRRSLRSAREEGAMGSRSSGWAAPPRDCARASPCRWPARDCWNSTSPVTGTTLGVSRKRHSRPPDRIRHWHLRTLSVARADTHRGESDGRLRRERQFESVAALACECASPDRSHLQPPSPSRAHTRMSSVRIRYTRVAVAKFPLSRSAPTLASRDAMIEVAR